MIKILSFNEIDSIQWQQLVERSDVASFFQTKECYDFYQSLPFFNPFLYAVSENEKLVGLVCGYIIADGKSLKRFFSRRAIIPGGLLLDNDISKDALSALLEQTKRELKNKAIYIEIRNYADYSWTRDVIENNRFSYQEHLNFHVPTPDYETALNQLSSTKRRDIKLSIREGAEYSETSDDEEICVLYEILQDLYEKKIKTPLFPLEFFKTLARTPNGKIFVIKKDNKLVGGCVCVCLPNRAIYEWFVCGTDGHMKNVFPSTLATWSGIEYAATNNYPRFDMMGAGKPNEGYGVREFKEKFGGKLVEHGRFLHVNNRILYSIGKRGVEFLKTMKS